MTLNMNAEFKKAVRLFQIGDLDGASALCESILQTSRTIDVLHLEALCLTRLGKLEKAKRRIDDLCKIHPNPDVILVDYGFALRSIGELSQAVSAYEKALECNIGSQKAHSGLAVSLSELGRPDAAIKAIAKAVKKFPQNSKMLNNLGVILNREARFEEAISAFTKALECNRTLASGYVNRGRSYREIGEFDKAIADGTRGVELASDQSQIDALYQLANTLRVSGKIAEAKKTYEAALSRAPNRADLQNDFARMLWENGEGKQAFHFMDKAIRQSGDPRLALDRAEFALLSSDLEVAHQLASNIVTSNLKAPLPIKGEAFAILAKLALSEGRTEAALKFAVRAIEAAPENFAVLHRCCEIELSCGLIEPARRRLMGDAPKKHLQKHIALRCLALKAAGDLQYLEWYDYDRFVKKMTIEKPEGYESVGAFNDALEASIRKLHASKAQPLDQTLFGGTQSFGTLWRSRDPVIQDFARVMRKAVEVYVNDLPDDPDHPFLRRKAGQMQEAGSWSVILNSGGGHVDHIHPAGWISASYYVRIPAEVEESEHNGSLRLGGSGIAGLSLEPDLRVLPSEGSVVFFPSYVWHGVEPFSSAMSRIAAPFDVTSSI